MADEQKPSKPAALLAAFLAGAGAGAGGNQLSQPPPKTELVFQTAPVIAETMKCAPDTSIEGAPVICREVAEQPDAGMADAGAK
jgi:hypothetical protein